MEHIHTALSTFFCLHLPKKHSSHPLRCQCEKRANASVHWDTLVPTGDTCGKSVTFFFFFSRLPQINRIPRPWFGSTPLFIPKTRESIFMKGFKNSTTKDARIYPFFSLRLLFPECIHLYYHQRGIACLRMKNDAIEVSITSSRILRSI